MGDEFYNGPPLADDAPAPSLRDGSCVRVSPQRYRAEVEATTREHVETLTRSPEYRRWKSQYDTTPPSQREAQRRRDREEAQREIPDDPSDVANTTSASGSSGNPAFAGAAASGSSIGMIAAVGVAVLCIVAAVVISQQQGQSVTPNNNTQQPVINDPTINAPSTTEPVPDPSVTATDMDAEALAAEARAREEEAAAEAKRIEDERIAKEKAEAERVEAERKRIEEEEKAAAAAKAEAERIANEKAEAERIEAERIAKVKVDAEVAAAAQAEADRIAAEKKRLDEEAAAAAVAATTPATEDANKEADDAAAKAKATAEAEAKAKADELKRQAEADAKAAEEAAAKLRAEEEAAAEAERLRLDALAKEAEEAAAKAEADRIAALQPKPATVPRDVRASQNEGSLDVSVTFTAPESTGNTEILSYIITSVPVTSEQEVVQPSSVRMTGLTVGTSYTFYVVARNAKGDSPAGESASLTIAAVPKKPRVADPSGLLPCQSVVAVPGIVSAMITYDCGEGSSYDKVTATSTPDGLSATAYAGANITVWGLKPSVVYTFTVVANTARGVTPVSDDSNSVTSRSIAAPIDWAAYTAVARVWIPSRPYRDQAFAWYKRHEEAVHKVVVYIILLIVAIKLWSSLHDSLLPQYHPDAITSRASEPIPTNDVEQNARKRVIDDRKTNAAIYAASPPITPARGLVASSSGVADDSAAAPPLPNIPPPPPPFDAPPMNAPYDAPVFDTPPASPTPSSPTPAPTKKTPVVPGKTGLTNGNVSSPHAKKSLDELNKTPNPATQRSIANAVAAAALEPTLVTPPVSSPAVPPSSPAPTPLATSTTPGRGSSGSATPGSSSKGKQYECKTLDLFTQLTQGNSALFIDIRDPVASSNGHLLAPHHINVPVSQADVDNKVSLKDIEERHKDVPLFSLRNRSAKSIIVYGQSNEAAVVYLTNLLASVTGVRLTNPFHYATEGVDGFVAEYGTQMLCSIKGTATSLATWKPTHAHGLFLYPSCIVPSLLFLGSQDNAAVQGDNEELIYPPQLKHLGITHILNVTKEQPAPHADKNDRKIVHLRFPLDDEPSTDIASVFEPCFKFIDDAARGSGRVLLHCQLGISRSVTVAIAYIMRRQRCSLKEAWDHVKKRRQRASPNPGFWRALAQFEQSEAKSRGVAYQSTLAECVEEDMLAKINALPPFHAAPVTAAPPTPQAAAIAAAESKTAAVDTTPKKGKHSRNQSNGKGSQSPAPVTAAVPEASPVKYAPAFPTAPVPSIPAVAPPATPSFVPPTQPVAIGSDDFLYLGDIKQGTDVALLRNLGMTHVLATVSEDESSTLFSKLDDDIDGQRVALPTGNGDLAPLFAEAIAWINKVRAEAKDPKRVLIYCDTGASRSAVVAMAYLVSFNKITLKAAYDIVRGVRPDMTITQTQWTQLSKLEKGIMGGVTTVKECNAEYKSHSNSNSIDASSNGNGTSEHTNGAAATPAPSTPTSNRNGHQRTPSSSGKKGGHHRRKSSSRSS